jgi:glucuronate isomerase
MPLLHEDRLLPLEPSAREIAKRIYESVRGLPIIGPHGHTQAVWFARNQPFPDPAKLFAQPDHYVYRMLYSQGISLEDLEIGVVELKNPRKVWRIFAEQTIILFTLDESTYSRELAPLAGHYPCLRLGPPWWFHDSPDSMIRFRERVTETAGFYNTVGCNDDTRAFLSLPGRHDVVRRMDCAYLARLVAEHRLEEDEAMVVARVARTSFEVGT